MIYFVSGLNSRQIKIDEIKKEYTDISIFDASIESEYDLFLNSIYNVSLFSKRELIILRRAEKVKKMKNLIDTLKEYEDDKKDILIDYFAEYKTKNIYLKDFEKITKNIVNIENEDDLLNDYIDKNLKISNEDKKKLISLIGTDYNHIKNEIYKYNLVLKDEVFSFAKLDGLISESLDKKISDIVDNIMFANVDIDKINSSMYMGIVYGLYKEFEILHRLSKLKLSTDYNTFKKEYEKYKDIFLLHYYVAYLKNKNINRYTTKNIFKILLNIVKNETMFKSGEIDDKLMIFNIVSYINKNKKS
ncbi:DNA polymerase III subunit delta [Oceanivirga miroungae]|uniref:DNA polymerase III subunit delta n=1 Tax=Oceanivirga miroungae TaxID=1130046 RepID=A0A6I8M6P7_9FUSO|nr:hypothetical protein [Oceanivirga miroungae]VWL85136.1 DNA polymerase III subunit delta [Oceanivirga miroungae]